MHIQVNKHRNYKHSMAIMMDIFGNKDFSKMPNKDIM